MFDARPGDLNAASRAAALAHLTDHEVDVLVIGGGITGAGVALDAATRGLTVGLVEARDLASGTSGFSSKLVHGGLRYLAKGDVALAWESAVEREALMRRIAPHLVQSRAFLVPRFSGGGLRGRLEDALTETGIRLADVFRAGSRLPSGILPRPRRIDARAARLLAPQLRARGLRGGLVYWDGAVEDDARLVVALARTAARHGAHVVTGCRALRATARDVWVDDGTGSERLLRARAVINAAGVWADAFAPGLPLTPSRGTHLVFDSARLGNPQAVMTAPVPGHFGRYVFILPQSNGLSYLGLTDELAPGADGYEPGVPEEDIDFLLRIANASLDTALDRSDVLSSFAGLRPLVGGGADSASASRRHLVLDTPGAPITVTGGKLTVYRRMAEDAVDAAVARLGESPHDRPAVSRRVPVLGSPGSEPGYRSPGNARPALAWPGPDPNGVIAARLRRRYGWESSRVAAIAAADAALQEEVTAGAGVTGAEVAFAALAEGAASPADVLERRTRLALRPELAAAAAGPVESILARTLQDAALEDQRPRPEGEE
ncbi:glycerol-3-phosphate dehydrogenase/oxidase [Leucobacter komagatae]|uniref:glycerol-3-phosphate dehydrogenase/oxidase n=1 Tax=Leucobacter komagatae TaxID=55969 RepID=UPI0005ACDA3A|nr:glycerol-3-phosphate dehydrogenase/oxidase [Leucobacter komagatae]